MENKKHEDHDFLIVVIILSLFIVGCILGS
ncbi:hypothetical protein SAMN05216464_103336 [Mucilaginibacter pineti]|uniref:Uncharacterized protein n=1 Tax=Mucilaginibacter pineti TaxID=1391627 RepID=A0A1G6ZHS6_9SPHI|nr:hypothetical protein SAMN05216464_103336 [Mucilaginibacter pineti]